MHSVVRQGQTIKPGTMCHTLFDSCVGSLTSPANHVTLYLTPNIFPSIYRVYYTVARRYEFHVRVARTILFLPREHKIHFSGLTCNVVFIDGVFDDFRKISEDFPKLFRRPDERSRTFSENFRNLRKFSENCRRLSRKTLRCLDHTPTNLRTI